MSWTGTERSRRAQVPCQNYGAYPRYVLKAGARVRIQHGRGGQWRAHVMRKTLTFDAVRHAVGGCMFFNFDGGWVIYARREDVEVGQRVA